MNYFIVFDFETDGKDPYTCSPVQLAAMALDPFNLEIVENSQFCSDMRPEREIIDDEGNKKIVTPLQEEYLTIPGVADTLAWHCGIQKKSQEEVLNRWKTAPDQKTVWSLFSKYIYKYNTKRTQWQAPYAAGMNIKNFDLIISNRLNEKYNIKTMFNHEYTDIRDWAFHALRWDSSLKSRSMDNLRKYLGMSGDNAHDALKDVKDSAQIISRYMKFYKNVFNNTKYKGCMS